MIYSTNIFLDKISLLMIMFVYRSCDDGIHNNGFVESLHVEQILMELQSVAVDWKSLRDVKTCSCALPFEQYTKKVLCVCVCVCVCVFQCVYTYIQTLYLQMTPL